MQDCITIREIYFWSLCSIASSCIINKMFLTSDQVSNTKFLYMIFVKAGSRLPKTSQKSNCRLLHRPPYWVLLSDLGFMLVIPFAIVISRLRPDILLYPTSTKTVIILELTCPCEGNMRWCAPKFGKFESLCSVFVQQLKQTAASYISVLWSRSSRILCFLHKIMFMRLGVAKNGQWSYFHPISLLI